MRVLLRRGAPEGAAPRAVHSRRRLPTVVRLRELRDALEPQGQGRRADPGVPAVAALRLGACHGLGGAQATSQQSARPRRPATARVARLRWHPVPLSDGDRARRERWRGARALAHRPVGAGRRGADRGNRAGRPYAVLASLHRSTDGRRGCRGPEFYGDFAQVESGGGGVAALRERVAEGLTRLPRLDGRRVGVVTGTAMAPLMPPLLERLSLTTGPPFELMAIPNSPFGPTTTTAGLLVGADIRRALEGRPDLDLALIPAETINDDGLFLDDERFDALRDALTMPVRASYDFVDVLAGEPFGVGVAARGAA